MRTLLLSLSFLLLLAGCKEEVDTSTRYVFKYDTVLTYLQKHPQYSDYVSLLGKVPAGPISSSTLVQLLSARGNYTVFAPTNQAIQLYLDSLLSTGLISEASWAGFPDSPNHR